MKIAIPLTGGRLSSHFGHCEAFAIFITEDGRILKEETVDPPVHEPGSHPSFLHQLGCDVVISGGMGMRAQQMMCDQGVNVVVGAPDLPLKEIVELYHKGKLKAGANRCDH